MTYDEYIEITKQYSTVFHFDGNLHLKESEETKYLFTGFTGYDFNGCATVYKVYKQKLNFDEYEFNTGYEFVDCYTQKELNDAIKEQIIRMKEMKIKDRIKSIEGDFDA